MQCAMRRLLEPMLLLLLLLLPCLIPSLSAQARTLPEQPPLRAAGVQLQSGRAINTRRLAQSGFDVDLRTRLQWEELSKVRMHVCARATAEGEEPGGKEAPRMLRPQAIWGAPYLASPSNPQPNAALRACSA